VRTVAGNEDAQRAVGGEAAVAASGGLPEPRRHPRILTAGDWFAIGAVALVCGLAAFVGMPELREFEHDIFFPLDNAYRVLQGQIPHRDFASAWGPVFYLVEAAGLEISRLRPEGLAYANALFGAVVALWMYAAARARLAPVQASTLAIYTALLITAPFALGFNPLAFCFAMGYNRFGYALLGIIVVECGFEALAPDAARARWPGRAFAAGAAWALLVFLKISYAAVAVPFLLLWLCCGSQRLRRLAALCCGAGAVTAVLLSYLRLNLAGIFRDLADAASGRSGSWHPAAMLSGPVIVECIPLLLLAALLTAGTGKRSSSDARWRQTRLWLFVLLTAAVGGFLLATNHQSMTLPLGGFAALVLVDGAMARGERPYRLAAGFLAGLCFLPLALMNAVSLGAASWERIRGPQTAAVRLTAERGRSIVFGPVESAMTSETGGPAYVEALNDGLRLIRAHAGAGEGVMTMDTLNPFNYLLNRPSPRGGMASAYYSLVFSDRAHPSAERFFGDARYVLLRKYSKTVEDAPIEEYLLDGLRRVYGPALEERFVPVEETAHWIFYRRK